MIKASAITLILAFLAIGCHKENKVGDLDGNWDYYTAQSDKTGTAKFHGDRLDLNYDVPVAQGGSTTIHAQFKADMKNIALSGLAYKDGLTYGLESDRIYDIEWVSADLVYLHYKEDSTFNDVDVVTALSRNGAQVDRGRLKGTFSGTPKKQGTASTGGIRVGPLTITPSGNQPIQPVPQAVNQQPAPAPVAPQSVPVANTTPPQTEQANPQPSSTTPAPVPTTQPDSSPQTAPSSGPGANPVPSGSNPSTGN